jgi:radical SAM protein with 4Fe4S-binding SPASM domain
MTSMPVPASPISAEEMYRLAASRTPLASPSEAYFEVANRCNSLCATCPLTYSPQEAARHLSLDEFKILVDQLPSLRRAVLQGIGEPLLNRDLPEMIRYLKQHGVYVVFNTNATLLTRRRQLALIESGLDELRVSIDASTPETYRRVRGIPAFDRVVGNVAAMVRTQRELGVSTPGLSFWFTGMVDNLPELPALVELAAHVGVGEVYLQRLTYWGEGLASAEHSIFGQQRAGVDELLDEAQRRADRLGVTLRGAGGATSHQTVAWPVPESEPWRGCSRPLRLAYVTAQGTALPCCIAPFTDAPYEEITLGNYLQDGVNAVWNSERYQEFRRRLYSSEPPPSCRNCGLAWSL